MKDVLNIEVTPAELARIFGRSLGAIQFWTEHKGLHRNSNGLYNLRQSFLWLEKYYKSHNRRLPLDRLNISELAKLLNVTRQKIYVWRAAGLPKQVDGKYNLADVCRWLPVYYHDIAERKYRNRLETIRRRLGRNVRQLEKFIENENL